MTQPDLDDAIKDLLKTENYTVNAHAVEDAVRFMYTHWPDRMNATMRRKQFVNVGKKACFLRVFVSMLVVVLVS